MTLFRIAVATRCFNLPIKEAVRAAASCGARGVQLDVRDELAPASLSDTGRRQFLHNLQEQGLQVASLTFPTRRTFMDPDQLDARVAATKAAMQFAAQLKATVLTARVGRIPTDKESKEYHLLRDVLEDVAGYGNHVGVTFSIIPTLDQASALVEIVESVRTGAVGIDFDPGAFATSGQKPEKCLRLLHAVVSHVQGRDAIRDLESGGLEVPLGRGEVDWLELLPLLAETEYRGWITVNRTQGDDPGGDAARAVQFLKQVLL